MTIGQHGRTGGRIEPGDFIANGQKIVTTAGTQVALTTDADTYVSIVIKALAGNTGDIYVGDSDVSSSNGFVLDAGEAVSIDFKILSRIWIDSSVNGEGVSWLAIKYGG